MNIIRKLHAFNYDPENYGYKFVCECEGCERPATGYYDLTCGPLGDFVQHCDLPEHEAAVFAYGARMDKERREADEKRQMERAKTESPETNKLVYVGTLRQNDGFMLESKGGEWVKAEDCRDLERKLRVELLQAISQRNQIISDLAREIDRSNELENKLLLKETE